VQVCGRGDERVKDWKSAREREVCKSEKEVDRECVSEELVRSRSRDSNFLSPLPIFLFYYFRQQYENSTSVAATPMSRRF